VASAAAGRPSVERPAALVADVRAGSAVGVPRPALVPADSAAGPVPVAVRVPRRGRGRAVLVRGAERLR
jgi:hypothetical protein